MANIVTLANFAGNVNDAITVADSGWVSHGSYTGVNLVGTGNRSVEDFNNTSVYYRSATPGSGNQVVQGGIWQNGTDYNSSGMVARVVTGANTLLLGRVGASIVQCFKAVAGTLTQLGSDVAITTPGNGASKVLKFTVSGSSPNISLIVNYDGVDKITQTLNDATFDIVGKVGIRNNAFGGGNRAENVNFQADDDTGGGGSSIKTINGLAVASVKTVNGLAIASMKTRNGLA